MHVAIEIFSFCEIPRLIWNWLPVLQMGLHRQPQKLFPKQEPQMHMLGEPEGKMPPFGSFGGHVKGTVCPEDRFWFRLQIHPWGDCKSPEACWEAQLPWEHRVYLGLPPFAWVKLSVCHAPAPCNTPRHNIFIYPETKSSLGLNIF